MLIKNVSVKVWNITSSTLRSKQRYVMLCPSTISQLNKILFLIYFINMHKMFLSLSINYFYSTGQGKPLLPFIMLMINKYFVWLWNRKTTPNMCDGIVHTMAGFPPLSCPPIRLCLHYYPPAAGATEDNRAHSVVQQRASLSGGAIDTTV